MLGSLLGLLALTWGALFNFHLNRKRDVAIRSEEAATIAATLYGEIVLLRKELAQVARAVSREHIGAPPGIKGKEPFGALFQAENQISDPLLYKALAPRIGLLRPEMNLAIVKFHQDVQLVKTWLPRLEKDDSRPYSYSSSSVLEPARDAVRSVVPALRSIERLAGISPLQKTSTWATLMMLSKWSPAVPKTRSRRSPWAVDP